MPKQSKKALPALPVVYNYLRAHDPYHPDTTPRPMPLPAGEVTYLHFHNMLELAYCVSGTGLCHVEGRVWPFAAGDVQIVFPYQPHLSQSTGSTDSYWYWLNIDPDALLSAAGFTDLAAKRHILQQEMGLYGIIDRDKYPEICALVRQLVLDQLAPTVARTYPMERQAAGFYSLLTALREASVPLEKLQQKNTHALQDIAPALLAIRQAARSAEPLAIAALPRLCGMSPATFRRRFAAAVGMSASQYATACRMHQACRLLRDTDTKIIDIAAHCGFEDISGFNRCFLKYMGMTPREYRKKE